MDKLAYTISEAAAVCGVSEQVIRRAQEKGDLVYRYPTTRPVILADDLRDWLATAPLEPKRQQKKAS